jgi:hypothetical protein
MEDRRRYTRRTVRLVLGIETDSRKDRAGLTRDVSPTGMSFRSPSRFSVGETIKLKFRDPKARQRNVEVFGTVVRTQVEPKQFIFRHLAAVSFKGHIAVLEDVGGNPS